MTLYATYNTSMEITLNELEQPINYWRAARPSTGEERALSPEVNALANVYATMIFNRVKSTAVEVLKPDCQRLIEGWRAATEYSVSAVPNSGS